MKRISRHSHDYLLFLKETTSQCTILKMGLRWDPVINVWKGSLYTDQLTYELYKSTLKPQESNVLFIRSEQ